MTMNLYRVAPLPVAELLIIAPTTIKATEIFVAKAGLGDSGNQKFIIERLDQRLSGKWRANLSEMLASGVAGVVGYDDSVGWFVEPSG